MAFHIDHNHPVLSLSDKFSELGEDFMERHNLNYIWFSRVYSDGSLIVLVNYTGFLLDFLQNGFSVCTSFQEEHEKLQSYFYLCDEELSPPIMTLAREKHNLHHGITLLKRDKNYYDLISFAMPETRSNAASYYLSHLRDFKQFSEDLLKKGSDLLKIGEKEKILLPPHMQDNNCSKLCLPEKTLRHPVRGKFGPTYITSQELFYLQLLSQGKSYKDIWDLSFKSIDG
ncbi:MAG: hypothetical protein Q8858_15760 [Bacteroidota bacterium]|nr:hypothetical protein [Bacteroidota bacterium]